MQTLSRNYHDHAAALARRFESLVGRSHLYRFLPPPKR